MSLKCSVAGARNLTQGSESDDEKFYIIRQRCKFQKPGRISEAVDSAKPRVQSVDGPDPPSTDLTLTPNPEHLKTS